MVATRERAAKTSQKNNGSKAGNQSSESSLQAQIAEAIQPLIGDLHEQISQSLRESFQSRENASAGEDDAREPEQPQAAQQNDDEDGAARPDTAQDQQSSQAKDEDNEESSPMDAAMKQTGESLRETFIELGKTLQHLLKTVQQLLHAVASLVKLLAAALTEGLGAGNGESMISKGVETAIETGKEKFSEMAGGAMSSFIGGGDDPEGADSKGKQNGGGLLSKGKDMLLSLVNGNDEDESDEEKTADKAA